MNQGYLFFFIFPLYFYYIENILKIVSSVGEIVRKWVHIYLWQYSILESNFALIIKIKVCIYH